MVSTAVINTVLSSLKANQETLQVISSNIANANSDGYSRREVSLSPQTVGGGGVGVQVENVQRKVDDFLVKSIRSQISKVEKHSVMNQYFDRISLMYGNPESGNSISTISGVFFDSLTDLANNPEQSFFKTISVKRAEDLTTRVSSLTSDLEDTRFEIDKEIETTIADLNNKIASLSTVNQSIADAEAQKQDKTALFDKRDALIEDISSIIDVTVLTKASGEVSLINNAAEFLTPNTDFVVEYQRQQSASSFINDTTLGAITITAVNSSGATIGDPIVLASSAKSSSVSANFSYGKLKGLLEMRDVEIPKLLAQLDEFAATVTDKFNSLHNKGSSYPPLASFTGTTSIRSTDTHTWAGKVRLAVVDSGGAPVSSPYAGESSFRPLTLDLSTLESGVGAGSPTMQDIVDEINEYYGPPQSRVVLGPFEDIKLAAVSDDDGPPMLFDFQAENTSAGDATLTITSVTVVGDGGVTVNALPSALTSGVSITAGDRVRTGTANPLSIDFSGGTTGPSYTVRVAVSATDSAGTVTTETIDYIIDDTETGIRNKRYSVNAVNGAQDGTIEVPSTSNPFLTASIVDSDGNAVSAGTSGVLKIQSSNSSYYLAIDEMTSQENGTTASPSTTQTSRGFSHFFGLNNFFVPSETLKNSALNFQVRSDIIAQPSHISTGELALSKQPTDGTALYTYELSAGGNETVTRMIGFKETAYTFDSAGTIATVVTTASDYAAQITSFSGVQVQSSLDSLARETSLLSILDARSDSVSGVNIDEELANMVLFQTAYAASAKVLNTISELFDKLFEVV